MHKTVPLSAEEREELHTLRRQRRELHKKPHAPPPTLAQKMADGVARVVGSWKFIIIQSVLLVLWMAANVIAWQMKWDPYPFILLNLVLSFQAAFTAPIIMMSQNRQAEIDRLDQQGDYEVNRKAELEIELLHEKIDLLRDKEIGRLIEIVDKLPNGGKAGENKS